MTHYLYLTVTTSTDAIYAAEVMRHYAKLMNISLDAAHSFNDTIFKVYIGVMPDKNLEDYSNVVWIDNDREHLQKEVKLHYDKLSGEREPNISLTMLTYKYCFDVLNIEYMNGTLPDFITNPEKYTIEEFKKLLETNIV